MRADEPWGIDVGAALDENFDDDVVATGAGGVEGEDAVDDRVDRLAVFERISDEAEVAR